MQKLTVGVLLILAGRGDLLLGQANQAATPSRPAWVKQRAKAARIEAPLQGVNPFALDLPPRPMFLSGEIQGDEAEGTAGDAVEGEALLQEAAEALVKRNRIETSRLTGEIAAPVLDPKLGVTTEAVATLREMAKDETVISEDAFGPIGPGRRERLAKLAGLTREQAEKLWPWADPTTPKVKDIAGASVAFGGQAAGLTQEDVAEALSPERNKARKDALAHTALTDAEVNFACYASIGFPFPIRVGKLESPPPDGFVIFNPEIMKADLSEVNFHPKQVTYRWMSNQEEVSAGTAEVTTFTHIPKPRYEVTHLWISSEDDVMAYSLVGTLPPAGIDDVRNTIFKWVVPANGPLRASVKLFGLRWNLMPGIEEITVHPRTRARLKQILLDLGMLQQGGEVPTIQAQGGTP